MCFYSLETRKCSLQTLLLKLVILIVVLGLNTKFITSDGNTPITTIQRGMISFTWLKGRSIRDNLVFPLYCHIFQFSWIKKTFQILLSWVFIIENMKIVHAWISTFIASHGVWIYFIYIRWKCRSETKFLWRNVQNIFDPAHVPNDNYLTILSWF